MSDYNCGYDPIEHERAEILMYVWGSGTRLEPYAGFQYTCDAQDLYSELLRCAGWDRKAYDLDGFAALSYGFGDPPFVAGYEYVGAFQCGEQECPHMHDDAYYTGEPPAHGTGDKCPLCEQLWTEPGYIYDGEDAQVLVYAKRPPRFQVTCDAEESSLEELQEAAETGIRRVLNCGPGQPLVIQAGACACTYLIEGVTEGTKARILRMIGARCD